MIITLIITYFSLMIFEIYRKFIHKEIVNLSFSDTPSLGLAIILIISHKHK